MANFNYNCIELGGHLSTDPEVRTTPTGMVVCSANIAVNRRTKPGEEKITDFFRITTFGKTAENFSRFFRKGSSAFVKGRMQITVKDDGYGGKNQYCDVIANEICIVDNRDTPVETHNYVPNNPPPATAPFYPVPAELEQADDFVPF